MQIYFKKLLCGSHKIRPMGASLQSCPQALGKKVLKFWASFLSLVQPSQVWQEAHDRGYRRDSQTQLYSGSDTWLNPQRV